MKMNLFCKQCMAALPILAAAFTTSCSDQDFDWEKAHGQNVEANYEQRFDKLFGAIDPNQNWDFSGPTVVSPSTRATVPDNYKPQTTDDYYNIESGTLDYMINTLKEGQDNSSLGKAFTMVLPECGFKITPIYQGQAGLTWDLHMVIRENGEDKYDILVWTKSEGIQKKTAKKDSWANLGTGDNTLDATATRAKSKYWGDYNSSPLPAYAEIYFYLEVTNNDNTYATKGTKQSSLGTQTTSGSKKGGATVPMMILLDCDAPSNVGTYVVDEVTYHNEVCIMGCEDANRNGSDFDYNDVVFIIEGFPKIPQKVIVEDGHREVTQKDSKRYMVEDMGYSDINSPAVKDYKSTDIDFNDIVIDFERTRTATSTWVIENGQVKPGSEHTTYSDWEYTATLRALGGTWDFQLLIGNDVVFQKSDADNYIDYNENYLIGGKSIDGIVVNHIYNTGYNSDERGDGNYNTNVLSNASFLGTLTSENIANWNPAENNLRFLIVDPDGPDYSKWNVDQYFNSANDRKNVYTITWPDMGAHPKIAAFKTNKAWQRERDAVSKGFFSTTTTWQ